MTLVINNRKFFRLGFLKKFKNTDLIIDNNGKFYLTKKVFKLSFFERYSYDLGIMFHNNKNKNIGSKILFSHKFSLHDKYTLHHSSNWRNVINKFLNKKNKIRYNSGIDNLIVKL